MTPKIVRKSEEDVSPYQFEGKVTTVISLLKSIVDRYGENVELNWRPNHYEPYDNEPSPLFEVIDVRLETPEEVKERVEKETRRAELIRKQELEQLSALKAKYENH